MSHEEDEEGDLEEYVYKILVVGDLSCGKTSFIHRYVNDVFSNAYRATIGVDFALKTIRWDARTSIRLQLWDIAGQERFGHMTRVYYKEAVGAFIVYDVTRERTFKAVTKWKADIDENLTSDGVSIPVVLLANKCDLSEKPISKEEMDDFCKENGFIGWFATSAKEKINIDEAGSFLVEHILRNDPKTKDVEPDDDILNLSAQRTPAAPQKSSSSGCSC
eukprot:TRINITY_DN3134_c0_g1_i1.p1 TRINITY_DN3134_c0_g1~~TRINITY_DN3134_c0_g1_i1.p1  ORF type:complete len:219 (-),score=36.78 TRINITY_DN3134_c0_g1_i1:143-799(-)